MNHEQLSQHPYIQQIIELNRIYDDRAELHRQAGPVLQAMGNDSEFLKLVLQRNFDDEGYLKQTWSQYNIPFLCVYENEDVVMKIHFFASHPTHATGIAAHCIHHHNNYMLTTAAILGSGYETMLFDKYIQVEGRKTKLRVNKHFTQQQYPVHTINSWEPHIVYLPETYSATLQLWTPDKKRATDSLRHNPLLKAFKTPLRKAIQLLGMEKQFGISVANTVQWYPDGDAFTGIDENEYFAPTRSAVGPEIDSYSIQTVCRFIQEKGIADIQYLQEVLNRPQTPSYYKPWLQKMIQGEDIPETFAKTEINIPMKSYTREDVMRAAGYSLS
jgi:hypothetical protein